MLLSEFDYTLPRELIATHPPEDREKARLMILGRHRSGILDDYFYNLSSYLKGGDVLVLNDSKVIPARIYAEIDGRKIEILLLEKKEDLSWECWLKPAKKIKPGAILVIGEKFEATILDKQANTFIISFNCPDDSLEKYIDKYGLVPLPPYIIKRRKEIHQKEIQPKDKQYYQTVYAKIPGSVAAPTAGLHFTEDILERLSNNGIQTEKVTLHVGAGTFEPIRTEIIENFKIHSEYFSLSPKTAEKLNIAKKERRRIIAVGTTVVRGLEAATNNEGIIEPFAGKTNIFIYPGYNFRFVDGMITNFHLPKSSLFLLVSAFAGEKVVQAAYHQAIDSEYHFYSYGDAMLII